jgi:hypothetical protein
MKTKWTKLILISLFAAQLAHAQENPLNLVNEDGVDVLNTVTSTMTLSNNARIVTGYFYNSFALNSTTLVSNGKSDIYVAKLTTDEIDAWAFKIGGIEDDKSVTITFDETEQMVYVEGDFKGSIDFDPSSSLYELSSIGGLTTGFIAKYNFNGAFISAKTIGISNTEANTSIEYKVFPNPSNGEFTITTQKETFIDIFNVAGQLVLNQKLNAGNTIIDMKNYKNGVYFIKDETNGYYKIVKTN